MKLQNLISFVLLSSFLTLAACSAAETVNTQATIDAAVKATSEAQVSVQASIDAAVKATTQSQSAGQKSSIDQAVQATLSAQPTPDTNNLSEEELAALIDETVNQAISDYALTSSAVTQSTSDGTVTSDEVAATTTSVTTVAYEVAYAEELIQAYYDTYGAYAEDALTTMNAMEQDLAAISSSLNEVAVIMEQGADAATVAIDQLNTAVTQAQTKASELQTKLHGLQDQVKTGLGQRENNLLGIQADNIANNQIGAINQAHDFLDAFKSALDDGKFSPDELANIGQLAANARASLDKTGDPQLQKLSGSIEGLTRSAARGDWGRASQGLGDFERSLPKRRN